MVTMKVLVVDDEAMARRRMLRLLEEEDDVEVVGACGSGGEAVEAIRRLSPDLVLLDVQMPEMDGFSVIDAIGAEQMPAVIFITAYNEYAVKAFEVHALDYLLKPFTTDRFREALERARLPRTAQRQVSDTLLSLLEELRAEPHEVRRHLEPGNPTYMEWFMVRTKTRVHLIHADTVDWIEADDNYVRLHAGKNTYLIREKISSLAARLDPRRFLRAHRSTIVNIDRIHHLQPWSSGDYLIVLNDGTELRLSRGQRAKLGAHIGEY
ncbi:MAG TPA: LytTR family DNA-binding domain-containing protein [Longimicrobiaceae bacterium]|nr:LytTR family DNA-binding domain-containing protein [Longimicrobiaceae bacterium]